MAVCGCKSCGAGVMESCIVVGGGEGVVEEWLEGLGEGLGI